MTIVKDKILQHPEVDKVTLIFTKAPTEFIMKQVWKYLSLKKKLKVESHYTHTCETIYIINYYQRKITFQLKLE